MPPGSEPPQTDELTGELPVFVRDALGGPEHEHELDAEDREVVAALVDLGLDPADAEDAVRGHRVPLVLAQQTLGEPAEHSLEDLSEASGVPVSTLREIRIALGLSLPEAYGDRDLRWAKLIAELLDVVSREALVRGARARGSALAAVARSDMGLVRDELILPMRQAGADDLTVSVALAETTQALGEVAREVLLINYEQHLEAQLNSELSAIAARSDAAEVEIAVAFVDVVGYTALSARVDPRGLDELLDAFERHVIDVTAGAGDVTVVKYLGDAVMLVAPDPVELAVTLIELTEEVDALEEAPLRGGLAAGSVLVREGDFFGGPVNMAARLTDLARAWSFLADEALADVLDGPFEVRRIRPVRIRGVGVRRPLAVRPKPEG